MSLEPYHRLGLALAIGLVVGVERGWRERELAEVPCVGAGSFSDRP